MKRTGIQSFDRTFDPSWKRNDIIRQKKDGHPFLVIHIYVGTCTILVDLFDNSPINTPQVLLPKNYELFASDSNMEIKKNSNDTISWQYVSPMPL